MDACAHNFERAAIEQWLDKHECCPISRKPLQQQDLIANHTLAERIDRWQWLSQQDGLFIDEASLDETQSLSSEEGSAVDELEPPRDIEGQLDGARRPRRFWKKKRRPRRKSTPLPPEFMLLPQEREVLSMVRARAMEQERLRRKRQCWTMIAAVIIVVIVIVVGLGVARPYLLQKEGEE